jgi:ABC-type antimicrobial peptide transport system permease subunit
MVPEIERVLASFAPDQPVWDVETMNRALYTMWGLLIFQLGAGVAASLGMIALILTIVGVYGVVSYDTSRKTREIAIRLALGARPADVLRMILQHGILIVGVGLTGGVVAAFAASHMVAKFLIVSSTELMV